MPAPLAPITGPAVGEPGSGCFLLHCGEQFWTDAAIAWESGPGAQPPARAFPEKTESGGIPLRRRIGFKNHTGEEAGMGWGSRIRRICEHA